MASLIAPAEVIVSIDWSGYEDGGTDGTFVMPGYTDAHIGTQPGEPLVVRPGEVEELGGADTSHIALIETPENPKLFDGVALVGKNAPCDAQVAAGDG